MGKEINPSSSTTFAGRFALVFALAVVVALTIASGLIHGRSSNRWGHSSVILAAAEKLEQLPDDFGTWQLVSHDEMSTAAIDMLECAAYVARTYENRKTGATVQMVLLLGPAGPISVHTPEVCYPSRNHTIVEKRQPVVVKSPDVQDQDHQFWALTFRSTDLTATIQRVYYAWSTGSSWCATVEPRYAFAGSPYLYKIQLASSLPPGTDVSKNDPCRNFLREFIPVAKRYLVEPSEK